jgi:UTP--glucose-1-phosphate uridylyltransferase
VDAFEEDTESRAMRIRNLVEKPSPDLAPSNLAIVGRYILSPTIFECLANLDPGIGGEIQLTDGIARLLKLESVMSYRYLGRHYDCGSKIGFLEATVAYGLQHPEVGRQFREVLLQAGRELESQQSYPSNLAVDRPDTRPALLKSASA